MGSPWAQGQQAVRDQVLTMTLAYSSEELGCSGSLATLPLRPSTKPMVAFQIYYYADKIYLSAGVKSNDVQYVTAGTGAVNVFMTIVTVSVYEAVVLSATRGGVKKALTLEGSGA